jgi:hypothetical protein
MGWREEQQNCDGQGGGAQRPVVRGNEPKMMGSRSVAKCHLIVLHKSVCNKSTNSWHNKIFCKMSALRILSWLCKCPCYWQEPEKGNLCSCLRPFSYWWAFHPFCSKLCPLPPAPPPRRVRKGTPSGNPPIVIICVCSTQGLLGETGSMWNWADGVPTH